VVPLYVKYKLANTTHKSLAHMWVDWYDEYLQAEIILVYLYEWKIWCFMLAT
jgi:hypothetical protein